MQAFLALVQANPAVFSGAAIAIVDLIFALNPAAKSNGLLHAIYVACGGTAGVSVTIPPNTSLPK